MGARARLRDKQSSDHSSDRLEHAPGLGLLPPRGLEATARGRGCPVPSGNPGQGRRFAACLESVEVNATR